MTARTHETQQATGRMNAIRKNNRWGYRAVILVLPWRLWHCTRESNWGLDVRRMPIIREWMQWCDSIFTGHHKIQAFIIFWPVSPLPTLHHNDKLIGLYFKYRASCFFFNTTANRGLSIIEDSRHPYISNHNCLIKSWFLPQTPLCPTWTAPDQPCPRAAAWSSPRARCPSSGRRNLPRPWDPPHRCRSRP